MALPHPDTRTMPLAALSLRSAHADTRARDPEMGVVGAGQQETEGLIGEPTQDVEGGEEQTSDLDLDAPLSSFFSKGLPVSVFLLLPVIWKMVYHYNHKEVNILSWYSGISMVCLIVSFLVHLAPIYVTTYEWIQKVSVRCKLAYLSVFLRIVAATLLLLFLDPVRHRVAILPLSVLVIGLLAYFLWENQKEPAGKYWGAHKEELKLRFDLSSQVVTFAYAGLLGTIIGYVKGSSNQLLMSGSSRGYMAPDSFLAYSIILGLLVQLLSTVPTNIWHRDIRKRMAKVYLRIVGYASLMLLVLGGVMAAEEILREWVFITFFIIVFIPVLCFWYEKTYGPDWFFGETTRNKREEQDATSRKEEQDDKTSQLILSLLFPLFTSLFAALMASNSKYSTERGIAVSLSGWFKLSVLSALHGVLSYAVRIMFFFEMPQMKSSAFPTRLWTLSMIATVPITLLLIACVGFVYPDEIKNIFS